MAGVHASRGEQVQDAAEAFEVAEVPHLPSLGLADGQEDALVLTDRTVHDDVGLQARTAAGSGDGG